LTRVAHRQWPKPEASGLGGGSIDRTSMLRRMYDWCVAAAYRPAAKWIMGSVSFAESSFFPIPPDAMLIPMSLARPEKAYSYAFLCTWTSVTGGLLGYAIGALLYDSVGQWVISAYGLGAEADAFKDYYAKWGALIILLKGLTPIPYKLVTITSGFAGYNLLLFVLFSVITRGARFYVLAFILHRYGDRARSIIEERLGLWATLAAVLIVVGIAAALYLI
jgi:membrane protein YqaA with SNARE-associated domain